MDKKVIELFAGVGGFRVGLNHIKEFDLNGKAVENGDWEFVWFNQWEPATINQDAFACYSKRFDESDNAQQNENISEVNLSNIPNHSLLVGGFPCQDYSVARSLSGEKGIEGKKGVLFWEIIKIAKNKKTPFLLLENVDRLLKSPAKQRGRDFGIMLRTFHENGYNVEWRVINAAEYGFAQKRRRVFLFAWKRNLRYTKGLKDITTFLTEESLFAKSFPIDVSSFKLGTLDNPIMEMKDTVDMTVSYAGNFKKSGVMINGEVFTQEYVPLYRNSIVLREILERGKDTTSYNLTENQIEKMKKAKGSKAIERKNPLGEIYHYSEGSMCFPDNLDAPGRTMLTSESSINRSTHVVKDLDTHQLRFLTEVEAERLQGFPDDWTNTGMNPKRRYFMMGNALVTSVIGSLEPVLSEIIQNEPL